MILLAGRLTLCFVHAFLLYKINLIRYLQTDNRYTMIQHVKHHIRLNYLLEKVSWVLVACYLEMLWYMPINKNFIQLLCKPTANIGVEYYTKSPCITDQKLFAFCTAGSKLFYAVIHNDYEMLITPIKYI